MCRMRENCASGPAWQFKGDSMYRDILAYPIPVEEIDSENVTCAKCNKPILDEAYIAGFKIYICEECKERIAKRIEPKAASYARKHCKIIRELPKYHPENEYRCTSDEYEMGLRDSYSPNSYMCDCRHNCTNYEELIRPLDSDNLWDGIFYLAICERITDLLNDKIDEMEYAEDEEEDYEEDIE